MIAPNYKADLRKTDPEDVVVSWGSSSKDVVVSVVLEEAPVPPEEEPLDEDPEEELENPDEVDSKWESVPPKTGWEVGSSTLTPSYTISIKF